MTDVSTSWEHIVDALLRNHKYFPSVNLFQKWKILISINWAVKYASIDPKNAGPDKPNTFSNVALSRGDLQSDQSVLEKVEEKKDSKSPKIPSSSK